MNSQTFGTLLKFVKPWWREYKGGRSQTTVLKMLDMTLCYLGSQTTIRHLAIQFGVMTDAFIQATEVIMKVLMDMADSIIKSPNRDEYHNIAEQFNKCRVMCVLNLKCFVY